VCLQSLFQEKDYLNHRYFHKRAYYIACIAAGIEGTRDLEVNLQYEYQNANLLQPVIIVSPVLGRSFYTVTQVRC